MLDNMKDILLDIKLKIEFNKLVELSKVQSIDELINITVLNLGSCGLEDVPDSISNLTKLKVIYLHDNQLCTIPKSIIKLINLESLFLDYNNINNIPDNISELVNLKQLRLHHNLLKREDIIKIQKLLPNCSILI